MKNKKIIHFSLSRVIKWNGMKIKRSEKYLVVIKTDGIESEMSANEIHK